MQLDAGGQTVDQQLRRLNGLQVPAAMMVAISKLASGISQAQPTDKARPPAITLPAETSA